MASSAETSTFMPLWFSEQVWSSAKAAGLRTATTAATNIAAFERLGRLAISTLKARPVRSSLL
jgi:hypothetical protein